MRQVLTYSLGLIAVVLLNGASNVFQTAAPPENLDETVKYQIQFVARSDCTFIRNGTSHTPKEASEHMKAKYEYFKGEIKTPEDFIRLAATKSIMTGKAYLVKTKDGNEIECDVWLTRVLHQYRKSQSELK